MPIMKVPESNNKDRSLSQKIGHSIWLGAPRAAIGFAFGHPLDVVKTRMQANPTFSRFASAYAKELYSVHGGIAAFYKGGIPNFSRTILKETYRSPGRGFLLQFWKQCGAAGTEAQMLTGLSMAFADNAIAMPMERLKVWLMTVDASRGRSHVLLEFFTKHPSGGNLGMISDLYKGFTVASLRSCISWWSYLIPEYHIRNVVVATAQLDKDNVSIMWNTIIGVPSGIFNGICTLPFDTIKSQMQKYGNIKNYTIGDMTLMCRQLTESHGFWRGLYPGFNVRLLHYVVVGALSGNIIPQVDKIWANKQ